MNIQCPNCFEIYDSDLGLCPHCGYTEGEHAAEALHMDPGNILQNRYRIGRVLGFGGFGVTYLAWDMVLETKVAIKEYLPSEFSTRSVGMSQVTVYSGNKEQQFRDGLEKFVAEAKRLAKFQNEAGIVRIFDSFMENNTAYIVMEYLEGETLTSLLEREGTLSADAAIGLLSPVINSLQTVHAEGIIHRDIAPDNIMITKSGEVKLIDFGAARYATTSHSRSLTVIIKPGYSPEEQYRSRGDQGPHTDVYAAAAVLYRMITGVTPPDALERRAYFENGKKDILDAPSKYVKGLDSNVENALLNAMNVRIEDRTPDMGAFFGELTSDEPVKRRAGKIKKIDALKWPLWAKIAVPVGMIVVITVLALFFTHKIGFDSGLQTEIIISEGMSRVPSVVNDSVDSAEERLYEAGLLYEISGKDYSDTVAADLVLEQDVAGGAVVAQNTVIYVRISSGAQTEVVPSVLGISENDAVDELETLGFKVETEEAYSVVVEEGYVIAQSISAGTVSEVGSAITIVISLGWDPDAETPEGDTTVSDFVGMTYEEALEEAKNQGLVISIIDRQYSGDYEENVIMEQSIEEGETVSKRSCVELIISLGKETIKVPDVQYADAEEATEELEALGLTVELVYEESETVGEGLVISQSVEAGEEKDTGASITLTVSTGAPGFEMPDVTNETKDDATEELKNLGLNVTVTYRYDKSVDEGIVLEQDISEGEEVKRGDKVTIVVSSGQEVISVADVVGMTQDDAEEELEDQGFTVSITEVYDDEVEIGCVVSQTPEAGSDQKKNTQITLTVSKGEEGIKSIEIASEPTKTDYYVGDTLDTSGLTLTATYNSGNTMTISTGFSCDVTKLSKAGTQTVTVTFEGKTTSFDVFVSEEILEVLAVETAPETTSYYVGDTLSTAGLTLTATYSSGSTETISSGFTCSPTTLSAAGTQEISVTYEGITATFVVTVNTPSIAISQTSLSLSVGEAAALSAAPTPGGDVSWSSSDPNVVTVSGGTVTAVGSGSANITASFTYGGNEYSATCAVTVYNPVTVTYNANGGYNSYNGNTISSANINSGDGISYFPDFFRYGYVLDGWYTSPSGGTLYSSGTPIYEDITLYAHWSVDTYPDEYNSIITAYFYGIGDTMYLDIPILKGAGIASGDVCIMYDANYLTVSAEPGDIAASIDTTTSGQINVSFTSSSEVSGTLLLVTFKAKQDISDMTVWDLLDFSSIYSSFSDVSGNEINTHGGSSTIYGHGDFSYGHLSID